MPGFRPTSSAHLYRLEYVGGTYTVYVDGKAVASAESQVRPDGIGIGHPPVYTLPNPPESTQRWAYWGWTSSKTDYVRVEAMAGDNNNDGTLGVFFFDGFDGMRANSGKWLIQENTNMSGHPAYGGSVAVANGEISLSSRGSGFPCVYSRANPFPLSGDFSAEFNFTYTKISDWGCGLWISNGNPLTVTEGDSANSSTEVLFQLWADNEDYETAQIFAYLMGKQVFLLDVHGWGPSAPTQNFKLNCSGQTYTLYIDGKQIATATSTVRPNSIGFGHPPCYYIPFSPEHVESTVGRWGSFKIDFIKVLGSPSDHETGPASLSLTSDLEALQLGLVVDVSGRLTRGEDASLSGETVVLSFSVPGTSTSNAIAAATTDPDGFYDVSWIPTATGSFILKAEWTGNEVYAGVSAVKNISVTRSENQGFFFAESNSTLSSLSFNSTLGEIHFTVSGPSGTTGYVKFVVSKELVPDASALRIFLDGKQLQYTVASDGETWLLTFEYSHSTHDVLISIPQGANGDNSFAAASAAIIILALAAPLGLVALFRNREKQNT